MNSCDFTIGEEWERFLLELSFQQAVARRYGTRTWWVVFPASLCCIFFDCKIGFFSKLAQIIKILFQIYCVVLSHVDRKAIGFALASNIFKRDQTINGPNEPRGRRSTRAVGILSCRGCKWTLRQPANKLQRNSNMSMLAVLGEEISQPEPLTRASTLTLYSHNRRNRKYNCSHNHSIYNIYHTIMIQHKLHKYYQPLLLLRPTVASALHSVPTLSRPTIWCHTTGSRALARPTRAALCTRPHCDQHLVLQMPSASPPAATSSAWQPAASISPEPCDGCTSPISISTLFTV